MSQLVFIHGPGAGGCAEAFRYQLDHFRGSIAPTLPGHLAGEPCASVERYTEWVRGWLWAQGHQRGLVLVGFTLGSCIALQYALDYPEEVRGLVLMTVSMRSKRRAPDTFHFRLRAAADQRSTSNGSALCVRPCSGSTCTAGASDRLPSPGRATVAAS